MLSGWMFFSCFDPVLTRGCFFSVFFQYTFPISAPVQDTVVVLPIAKLNDIDRRNFQAFLGKLKFLPCKNAKFEEIAYGLITIKKQSTRTKQSTEAIRQYSGEITKKKTIAPDLAVAKFAQDNKNDTTKRKSFKLFVAKKLIKFICSYEVDKGIFDRNVQSVQ